MSLFNIVFIHDMVYVVFTDLMYSEWDKQVSYENEGSMNKISVEVTFTP